jgi:hypothetical protein
MIQVYTCINKQSVPIGDTYYLLYFDTDCTVSVINEDIAGPPIDGICIVKYGKREYEGRVMAHGKLIRLINN